MAYIIIGLVVSFGIGILTGLAIGNSAVEEIQTELNALKGKRR